MPYGTFEILQSACIVISQGASIMGVATNVINIVVFVKMGLRETTTISMMCLAVSDLLICGLALWSNLLLFPPFMRLRLPFRPDEMFIMTGGSHRVFVSRTSAFITTYIAIERCLCVITPLKVKSIITRGRTIVVLIVIFIYTIAPSSLLYGNYRFVHRFYPDVNRTLLGIRYIDGKANIIADRLISIVNGTVNPLVCFCMTCICTVFLVIHLSRSSKWRESHSNTGVTSNKRTVSISSVTKEETAATGNMRKVSAKKSSKEDRVARTVVSVSVVFIICFLPNILSSFLYLSMPGFSLYGKHRQFFLFLYAIGFSTESVNSSVNIFIYYRMGSNFRHMIYRIFKVRQKK